MVSGGVRGAGPPPVTGVWYLFCVTQPSNTRPQPPALTPPPEAARWGAPPLPRGLSSFPRAPRAAGWPAPPATAEVRLVWQGIVRTHGSRPQRRAEPAVTETLRALVAGLDDGRKGHRDRALLLLGFAGFLRRSELVALDVGDVVEVPEGLEVLVRRSQTDQLGEGAVLPIPWGRHAATCPVRAWRAWLQASNIVGGPP